MNEPGRDSAWGTMTRAAAQLAQLTGCVRLHRRRQRVVVRAGSAVPAPIDGDRRSHTPTLIGLGVEQRLDTQPDSDPDEPIEAPPVSHVRPVLARTLREGAGSSAPEQPTGTESRPRILSLERSSSTIQAAAHPSRLPPPPPPPPPRFRARPETLLDDVDDERAAVYLAEARRILDSGYFERPDLPATGGGVTEHC